MTQKVALDTNAYRALDDGNPRLADHIKAIAQIGLPIPVLGELYHGVFLGNKYEKNLSNLNRFLLLPRLEVLHIDEPTAKLFGEIATELRRVGRPMQQNDIWIAALCKQHGYRLATNDVGFENVLGLEIVTF